MRARVNALSDSPAPVMGFASMAQGTSTRIELDDGRGMTVLFRQPPIIDRIREAFPIIKTLPPSVQPIFTFGDVLYNPGRAEISHWLLAHELTHTDQQGTGVATWWDRYLVDPEFRFQQELEAHRNEYALMRRLERNQRKRSAQTLFIADRLSGPFYGALCDFGAALKLIRRK